MAVAPIDRCYWTADRDSARRRPLEGEIEADVAIIGGGIVGTIAARLLIDRGFKVSLVEAGKAGHGVTGRSTAKVTAQHSTFLQRIEKDHGAEAARAYAAANQAGVALIAELVQRHAIDCDFDPADSLVYATTRKGAEELERERAAAEPAGLPMELGSTADLPYPVEAALRLPGQAQFQPAAFVEGLAKALADEGCLLFENSPAMDWDETSVRTSGGSIRARHVIMATHLPLGSVGGYFAHTSPHMHAVMAVPVEPDRAPAAMYISVDEPKRSLRRHRRRDGETMLILTGPRFTHGDAEGEAKAFAELESFARDHFGWTGGGYRWSNEDYQPSDGLPFVGWSGSEGKSLLVATGFDAWGLSNGAAAALMLADLCQGRENTWTQYFDASRRSVSGLAKSATDSLQVAAGLVGAHLRPPPDKASPNEGEIVEIGGRAAGVYRDGNGSMRAVSAVCTHMGCMLGWNPVDRTWDCGCHGSRFAADGQVLHGPASEPLGAIDWAEHEREAAKMRDDLRSTAAVKGHPLHPMVVPIPIALFVSALVTDILFVVQGSEGWAEASKWLLGGGLAGAVLAAVTGLTDFAGNARIREIRDAWLHMFANVTVVIVEVINLIIRLPDGRLAGSVGIILSTVAALLLLFSGWKGGELVFRHGVGQIGDKPRS